MLNSCYSIYLFLQENTKKFTVNSGGDTVDVDVQELRQRGVCAAEIETALENVFTSTDALHENENAEDDGGRWGMTKEASKHLWEKAKLQWERGGNISAEVRKRRMVGWLQRRGFNWSITSQILNSLESQDRETD